jgi:hypothetical protein
MFSPRDPASSNPQDPAEKRVDHMSIGAADAPTTYVKSYDEGRPPK